MQDQISPQVLSDLIGSIYDCALDPEHWDRTLNDLKDAFNSGATALGLMDRRRERILISRYAGLEGWRELEAIFSPDVNRMLARFASEFQPDEPQVISRLPQAYQNSLPLIQDGLKPRGFIDAMGYFLSHTSAQFSTFGVGRLEGQGVFTDREITLGGLLLPHLRRSVTISGLLDARTVERARMAETLDALKCGVVLTNSSGSILHANRAAEGMMRYGGPIQGVRGALHAKPPAAARELRSAISLAAKDEASLGKTGLAIRLGEEDEPAQYAHVLPLAGGELRTRLDPEAVAAVFVGAAADDEDGAEAMAAAFSLTFAESRLIENLLAGHSLKEAGAALGVATTTVKTHLKNIFQKTGVRRQAELIRLAARVATPARASKRGVVDN
jgi:DNA-binding CsgD family transcriptional regulator/PAS domain-containing protein